MSERILLLRQIQKAQAGKCMEARLFVSVAYYSYVPYFYWVTHTPVLIVSFLKKKIIVNAWITFVMWMIGVAGPTQDRLVLTFCHFFCCFLYLCVCNTLCYLNHSCEYDTSAWDLSVMTGLLLKSLFQVVPSQVAVAIVHSLTTKKFQEQVEEGEEEEEEVTVTRQRKEDTCYGAALGARPPRGPVPAAGSFCICYNSICSL